MKITATFHTGKSRTFTLEKGQTLVQGLFLQGGFQDIPLCAGLGKCGLCKVQFTKLCPPPAAGDSRRLTKEQLAEGWRLSCLHNSSTLWKLISEKSSSEEDTTIAITLPEPPIKVTRKVVPNAVQGEHLTLAVDLGTTGLQWQAVNDGKVFSEGKQLNPQSGLGSEVMSRLAYASTPQGATALQSLVTNTLYDICQTLEHSGAVVDEIIVSGNSSMTYLLLGLDVSPIATAPYTLPYKGDENHILQAEGGPLPPLYIPPLYAPFVGADLSAGLLALLNEEPAFPFLLADLGTNGEFILIGKDRTKYCTSVPMGPALEGVGLTHGRVAAPECIYDFTLTPAGISHKTIDPAVTKPEGITGTGYIALTALLLSTGVITESGLFTTTPPAHPFGKKLWKYVDRSADEPYFHIGSTDMKLAASDIEEILKVKAAFNLATSALLKKAQLSPAHLKHIFLAGAMGEHINTAHLETLGFIPTGAGKRTGQSGNTSLRGTVLLQDKETRNKLRNIPVPELIDLTEDSNLDQHFLERMKFTYVQ
ncbi:MAG: ASKHA domain-containing protein [Desulfovibrio sp.]